MKMNSYSLPGSSDSSSEVVENIFKPLIEDIGRMVDDQVNLVQKKRLAEGHQKGSEIKVNALQGGCTGNGRKLTCAS
jgi:hypothetical protein